MAPQGKELRGEVRKQTGGLHVNGTGYKCISRLMNTMLGTAGAVVRRFRKSKSAKYRRPSGPSSKKDAAHRLLFYLLLFQ